MRARAGKWLRRAALTGVILVFATVVAPVLVGLLADPGASGWSASSALSVVIWLLFLPQWLSTVAVATSPWMDSVSERGDDLLFLAALPASALYAVLLERLWARMSSRQPRSPG